MEKRKDSIIIHFDYDCFYASVVENENPALKTVPLGIQQKNILATCNYVARAQGVKKLQLITAAKKRCRDLVIVNGEDLTRFRNVSKNIWLFVREFVWSHLTERLGLDEIFVDATEMIDFNISQLQSQFNTKDPSFFRLSRSDPSAGFRFGWGVFPGHTYPPTTSPPTFPSPLHHRLFLASHLASFIRTQILLAFNHTCSAGISTSKLTAKLVGSVNKPDAQTLLLPGSEVEFLAGHEIGKVPGIGFKTAQKIRDVVLGRTTANEEVEYGEVSEKVTVGDTRSTLTPAQLEPLTGGNGQKIWQLLHGIDPSRVLAAPIVPTQISIEDTFRPGNLTNLAQLTLVLHQLTLKLLQRMHVDLIGPGGEKWLAHPRNFRLSVRFHTNNRDFARMSRSGKMPGYVFSLSTPLEAVAGRLVENVVMGLFKRVCTSKRWELQLVNVAAVNMVDGNGGVDIRDMFSTATPTKENLPEKEKESEYWEEVQDDYQQKDPGEPIGGEEKEGDDEVEFEWGDGLSDYSEEYGGIGSRGFEGNDPCLLCGARFPVFALEAHERFHEMGAL